MRAVRCALLGGETAELPGMYAEGEYDLAASAASSDERIIDGTRHRGQITSSACGVRLHSNWVLARAQSAPDLNETPRELGGSTVAQALLVPTCASTPRPCRRLRARARRDERCATSRQVCSATCRVLPDGLGVQLRLDLPRPPIFDWDAARGLQSSSEMRRCSTLASGSSSAVAAAPTARPGASLAAAGEELIPMGDVDRVGGHSFRRPCTLSSDAQARVGLERDQLKPSLVIAASPPRRMRVRGHLQRLPGWGIERARAAGIPADRHRPHTATARTSTPPVVEAFVGYDADRPMSCSRGHARAVERAWGLRFLMRVLNILLQPLPAFPG